MDIGLALLALIFALMLLGVPIYLALGAAGAAGLFMLKGNPFLVIPQSIYSGASFFPLLAIPFFILAGELMNRGGITERLVNFARLLIGKAPASLATSSVLACMFFGGVTGSAQADTSAIGGLLIPAMTKEGYKPAWSAALIAAASTCGPIVPPSIMMVIYCVTVGESIGAMFMGGIIPGIGIAVGLIIAVLIMNVKQKFPRRYEKIPFAEAIKITVQGILPLIMPVIIIGGILGGFFTPTEAGAVAVLYSLIIGFFVLKTLTVADLIPMFKHTAFLTANVLMIICCARILGWVFCGCSGSGPHRRILPFRLALSGHLSAAGQLAPALRRHVHGRRRRSHHSRTHSRANRAVARYQWRSFWNDHGSQFGHRCRHTATWGLRLYRQRDRQGTDRQDVQGDYAVHRCRIGRFAARELCARTCIDHSQDVRLSLSKLLVSRSMSFAVACPYARSRPSIST